MDELLKDGWFSEKSPLWPGQYLSLEVEQVLHRETSKYQDIAILQTSHHGRALVLDGIIQCTERDEFSYQEMMALVPVCAHPRPERVLIVGGGDGGVAREVVKHPLVRSVHQVEIDERVVALSKQFLPHMAVGFASDKVQLHIGDGFEFMRRHCAEYDVVITDSSDPVGPNAPLFHEDYFALVRRALRPGGVCCSQAGAAWLDAGQVAAAVAACRRHFPVARYGLAAVPTYPTGQIGFLVAGDHDPAVVRSPLSRAHCDQLGLRYYDADVHAASFVLPAFLRNLLADDAHTAAT